MQWRFWQKPGPQELPITIKNTLMSQFSLTSQSVDQMRFLGQHGRCSGRPVRFVRIFDPALISGGAANAKYHAFQLEASGDRKALVFEGHIENDGKVCLADRRPPMTDSGPTIGPRLALVQ
jgi:hypothetical protein